MEDDDEEEEDGEGEGEEEGEKGGVGGGGGGGGEGVGGGGGEGGLSIPKMITFFNDVQRDPRLNEILFPFYDKARCLETIYRCQRVCMYPRCLGTIYRCIH